MENFSIYYDFSKGIIDGQVANLYKAVLLCRTKYLYFVSEKKLTEYIEDPQTIAQLGELEEEE